MNVDSIKVLTEFPTETFKYQCHQSKINATFIQIFRTFLIKYLQINVNFLKILITLQTNT